MSDALKNIIDDDLNEEAQQLAKQMIMIVVECLIDGRSAPFSGILKSIEHDGLMHTIAARVSIDDAMAIVKARKMTLSRYEIMLGDDAALFNGPFELMMHGFDEIDASQQTCVLRLRLERS